MSICAFTSICDEDACWIPQYLAEAERLGLPFCINLDRCSMPTRRALTRHPLCIGIAVQDDPAVEFEERHKQRALDVVAARGTDWALAWDIDETFEADAPAKLRRLDPDLDCLDVRWLNLWGDRDHIRVDGAFGEGHRVKLLNLTGGRRWVFDHPITNGPKLVGREAVVTRFDLVTLHHGMMTPELRRLHKDRWDRIYTTAVGANPYGMWADACDETITPVLLRHGY